MLKAAIIHIPRLYKNNSDEILSDINYCASGLFSLASEIQKEGFSVEIINLGIEKYLNKKFLLSDYIKENNINFAAFSLHWKKQIYDTLEVIREVKKKNPNIHISLGGLTASYFVKEILEKCNCIDSIIKGEGEIPIRKLTVALNEKKNFSNIPNLCYINNGKFVSSQTIYAPSDDEYNSFQFFNPLVMKNFEKYLKIPFILNYSKENELKEPIYYPITLGRGCLGNCLWCGGGYNASKKLSGRTFVTYRNKKDIINEIKILKEKYGVKNFAFSFDPKGKEREQTILLLNEIKNEFRGEIGAYYNLDGLCDEEFLKSFKGAFNKNSILALSPVFENELLRKKYKSFYYSNEELENSLNLMNKMEIKSEIYFSIIKGVSDIENKKSEKYGEYLKEKYKYIKNVLIYPLELEPASLLYENMQKYNIEEEKKNFEDYLKIKGIENSFENTELFL